MFNKDSYKRFLCDIGFEIKTGIDHPQIKEINELLKSLPSTSGEIPRSPFDIVRLNYGFMEGLGKLSIKKLATIYCVSSGLIHSQLNTIKEKLQAYDSKLKLMVILNIPHLPINEMSFEEKLKRPIEELPLDLIGVQSVRLTRCLNVKGICTIKDLLSHSEIDLLRTPGLNRRSVNRLIEALESLDLKLKTR